jgi:LAS superfamily LD-carboxypeptidase LdcB
MSDPLSFSAETLTGRSRAHIVDLEDPRCSLHGEVIAPFLAMRAAARADGIDLVPTSSFRDFDRQLAIWNAKCRGERELRGVGGELLDPRAMSEDELVEAILIWSALPGASRHHWGTDMDVIDAAAVPVGYVVQLVQEEYSAGGLFAKLNRWLDENAARFGFFRPYAVFRGGVRPEPWHLSYAPVAAAAEERFSIDILRQALQASAMDAADAVRRRLPQIVERYVRNVDAPPSGVGMAIPGTRRV